MVPIPIVDPSGITIYSPKISDEALVRKFVSQNGRGYVALNIFDGVNSVDPDPDTMQLQVWFNDVTQEPPSTDPRGALIITVDSTEIQREDTGMYWYDIGPQFTQYRGTLYVTWTYQVNSIAFTFNDYLQILDAMPLYDSLNPSEQSIVEQVSWMFGDLFDSTEGGPYLIEPFQTHFNYERIAQMETIAVTRFNLTGNPPTTYGVGPGAQSLDPQFQGLIVIGTYIEVLRHLVRSYTEIPLFQQMNVTYTDRRDYFSRWQSVLQDELTGGGSGKGYASMVSMAKRSLLSLSSGSILAAGGIYGPNAGLFINSMYSAQVRSFRFYPAAFAIAFGGFGMTT